MAASAAASTASWLPYPNMSSRESRSSSRAEEPVSDTRWPSPRTTATGTAAQLASSPVGGRGHLVGDGHGRDLQLVPVRVPCAGIVFDGRTPETPMAWSVWPSRQARPAVSEMITPSRSPFAEVNRSRSCAALASGSRGRSKIDSAAKVRVVDAGRGERQAVVGTDNARLTTPGKGSACSRTLISSARRDASSTRPSALLMILDVTTTMSPSRSGPSGSAAIASSDDRGKITTGYDLLDPGRSEDCDHGRLISQCRVRSSTPFMR